MGARTGQDLSALRIDEGARKAGGPKWFRWFAAAVGALLLVSGAVFAFKGETPAVEVAPP